MMSEQTHKWMYDAYGLTRLMESTGFKNVCAKRADDSAIPNWSKYGLEMNGEKEYKPHSLYMEAVKP